MSPVAVSLPETVSRPPESPTPESSPPAAVNSLWGLTPADRRLLQILGGIAACLVIAHFAILSRWGVPPVEVTSLQPREYHYSLEINSATWVEWLQLPTVGETLARRIVEDREARGPFRSVDDVGRVRGIGPKTLEQIRPYLRLCEDEDRSNSFPR